MLNANYTPDLDNVTFDDVFNGKLEQDTKQNPLLQPDNVTEGNRQHDKTTNSANNIVPIDTKKVNENNLDELKEKAKRVSLLEFIEKTKTKNRYACPFCGSGKGDKRTGGIMVNDDNTFHCNACSKHGDVIEFYMKEKDVDFKTAIEHLTSDKIIYKKANPVSKPKQPKPVPDFTAFINECSTKFKGSKAETYINNRGISSEVAQRFNLGYSDNIYFDNESKQALIIPVSKCFYFGRNLNPNSDNRFHNVKGGINSIFNQQALEQSETPLFVNESVIDTLSIIEVKANGIALNGVDLGLLERTLKQYNKLPTLILCLDKDKTGDSKTSELIAKLNNMGINFIDGRFILNGCKDANEALLKDRTAFTQAVNNAIEQALNTPEPQAEQKQEKPPFIIPTYKYGKITGEKVSPPLLAEYIRNDLQFFSIKYGDFDEPLRFIYRDGVYKFVDDKSFISTIKSYINNYDKRLLKMNEVKEVLFDLSTDCDYVDARELDADANIINFTNGILKLDTMTLEPHSPKIKSTIQLPCEWSFEDIETPVYDNYLKSLVDGDTETIHLLNQYAGVALSNVCGYKMKQSLFLVGEGDSGKSQYKLLLEDILGDKNCCAIDLKTLERPFALVDLYRKRLAGTADMSYMKITELSNFKNITGGDTLRGEPKNKGAFNFRFNGVLLFCANKKPHFGGDDGDHVYRRMIFVDCPNSIPEDKQDKDLLDKMKKEQSGIIRKWILALKTVIDAGYRYAIPEKSKDSLKQFKIENSSILTFINECVVKRPTSRLDNCTVKTMYEVYKAWCKDNSNGHYETNQKFKKTFTEHFGYKSPEDGIIKNSTYYYKDYTLSIDCKKDYAHIYGHD